MLGALVARYTVPSVANLVEACHIAERTADMAMRTREKHLRDLFGADYRGGGKKPKAKPTVPRIAKVAKPTVAPTAKPAIKAIPTAEGGAT